MVSEFQFHSNSGTEKMPKKNLRLQQKWLEMHPCLCIPENYQPFSSLQQQMLVKKRMGDNIVSLHLHAVFISYKCCIMFKGPRVKIHLFVHRNDQLIVMDKNIWLTCEWPWIDFVISYSVGKVSIIGYPAQRCFSFHTLPSMRQCGKIYLERSLLDI